MRILAYLGLDTSRVSGPYQKVTQAIGRGDFRAAQVKKLVGPGHGCFYRAKLDDANRLLFSLVRHGDEVCALMLEVIPNHAYERSRFLRGAAIDETKIPDCTDQELTAAIGEAQPLRYLHPEHGTVHLLDKPISFDDAQEAIYRHPVPLILAGSAGSGKTALTLEKLKHAEGEVLYVTHSAFLARNARDLYYANGFDHPGQEALFLSYREFVESIRVPAGREAKWRDFAGWFTRQRQAFRDLDGHQAFEEIRGVLAAAASGVLSREEYLALGVRQSIFPAGRRDALYDLFERYHTWLAEARLYDLNLVAQDWQALATPRYDFVVIDEVQDITQIQLALVLKTLRKPGHFLLCGDSNQIVHPNFFSWAQVKTLFWRDPELAARQELALLAANFRNGQEATRVANDLLKIKQRRFGSIDRESNFLVRAVGGASGQVALLADQEAAKRELDQQIRRSTQFAVLVLRDEDKAAARRHFGTPLLFSIHEAKGLEYENIVLYRFVSDHRAEYAEIVAGVDRQDLAVEELDYRRAKDKQDKSLEIYKFYVNALYVALTRAIKNIYLVEADLGHPLFALLDLAPAGPVRVEARQASLEDWQKEARKLELQGKEEQAQAIRSGILKQTPVRWPVFDAPKVRELLVKVFREQVPGVKQKQQLFEIAAYQDEPMLAFWLDREARFDAARGFQQQRTALGRKSYQAFFARNCKEILRQCDRHGLEQRLPMNQTPLMAAAAAANVPLVEALLERGADRDAQDHFGWNALHWAMREAFRDPDLARGSFASLYDLLAPPAIDFNAGDRLVRIDRHLAEYFLVQTLWVLFKSRFTHRQRRPYAAFETQAILAAWTHLPANVVRPERNKRQHVSGVLSRNEVERDYAYNRALFTRVSQGWYQFNPRLAVRRGEDWVPVYQALNLPLVKEFALDDLWPQADQYLDRAGLPPCPVPIAAARALAREAAAAAERAKREAAAQAERVRRQEAARAQAAGRVGGRTGGWAPEVPVRHEPAPRVPDPAAPVPTPPELAAPDPEPPWGTPEAKQLALERLRARIAARVQVEQRRPK